MGGNGRHITIDDVAKACGVSKSTVSRAFSRPEIVAREVRDRIISTAKAMNYRPNPIARALNSSDISVIIIVVPTSYMFLQTELIAGCREYLFDHGHTLLVLDNSIYNTRTGEYMQVLQQQICNGVIFCFEFDRHNILEMEKKVPVVSYELPSPDNSFASVCTDGEATIRLAVEYLYNRGHRAIAAMPGRRNDLQTRKHQASYEKVMRELGLEILPEWVRISDSWGNESGYTEVGPLMRCAQPPTAIYCVNGNQGQGVMGGLRKLGYDVPGDVSVICGDGPPADRFLSFSLTYVNQETKKAGQRLAKLLLDQLNGVHDGREQVSIAPVGIVEGETVLDLTGRREINIPMRVRRGRR